LTFLSHESLYSFNSFEAFSKYFVQEINGSIAGYLLASDRSLESPQKAPTTFNVD